MVDIIGRAKVIAETIVDESQAKKAGKKAGEAAAGGVADGGRQAGQKFSDNFEGTSTGLMSKVGIGVGVAAGAAIATGIGQALQREAGGKRFAASLGLEGAEAAELTKTASEIYKNAWGASFEEVQRGVAATKSSFRDLSGEGLTEAATAAQVFADIFETDVVQAAGVASVAVKQGLAEDAVEAFDLMTAAAQQVPLQFRDELLEAVTEYSQFFSQIGIDGPEAFALLAEGAALGQYGIDKTGDAIKEFGIRAIDTSALTAEAFDTLNLDIKEMQDALLAGGDEGEEAFRKIVQGLDDIKDPSEQAATAIALFGTPIEDLGNEQIPVFIDALANGTTGLEDFEGATKNAGDTASDTFTVRAQGWGRGLNVYLGEVLTRFAETDFPNFSQSLDLLADSASDAVGRIGEDFKKLSDIVDEYLEKQFRIGLDDVPDAPDISQPASTRAVGGPAAGLTWVGERGPELLDLPAGSYVHSNANTRELVAASGGGDTFNITHIGNSDGLVQKLNWNSRYRRVGVQQGVNA